MKRVYTAKHAAFLLEHVFPPAYQEKDQTTADMLALLEMAAEFSNKLLARTSVLGDEQGTHLENGRVIIPKALTEAYQKYCEGGYLLAALPTEWGGLNIPETVDILLMEACAAGNMAFMVRPLLTKGVFHILDKYAPEKLKKICLPKLASGEWTASMDLTEKDAGSDVGNIKTEATENDGVTTIRGNKCFISNADGELTNTLHLVLTRFPNAPQGTAGISLVLVPKMLFDENGTITRGNGVQITGVEEKMGIKGSATCSVSFGEDTEPCTGWLIGEKHKGFKIMTELMNPARVEVGVLALGNATRAYEQALAYSKERVQFKEPIINFPDVRRMLLEMKARTEGLRALCCFYAQHAELSNTTKGDYEQTFHEGMVQILTPLIKILCTEAGIEVPWLSIMVHGGAGYIKETSVEQTVRDGGIGPIYEGTNGIQAIHFITRVLPKYPTSTMTFLKEMEKHGHQEWSTGNNFLDHLQNLSDVLEEIKDWTLAPILFHATNITRMFGTIVMGYMHLKMMKKAGEKLRQSDTLENQNFLENIIISGNYFLYHILPRTQISLEEIQLHMSEELNIEF